MNEIAKIFDQIKLYGSLICAPPHLLKVFNCPQGDGTPYIKITKESYEYIIEERGLIFEKRSTGERDILYYWLIKDIVSAMALDFEVNHRVPNQDPRRLSFYYQINLMEKIKRSWAEKRQQEIDEILQTSPYIDRLPGIK